MSAKKRKGASLPQSDLEPYLRSLEKAQLVELLLQLGALHVEVAADLRHRRALAGRNDGGLVQQVRDEIQDASTEEDRSDDWRWGRNTADYSRVRSGLHALLDDGQADAVIELGRELFEAGQRQVERSHHDASLTVEISDCLSIVFRALLKASLTDPEKILYAIDMALADDYGLVDGVESILVRKWSKATWSAVADVLAPRVQACETRSQPGSPRPYRREQLGRRLVSALDAAGRESEATELCEREAPLTGNYERLVLRLIEQKQLDAAKDWAERGYTALRVAQPGTASRLRELLRDFARRRRQWPLVAAYEAVQFFGRPSVPSFCALMTAARKAGCEREVRAVALEFLETGIRPGRSDKWPLPPTSLTSPEETKGRRSTEPREHWDVLRDLAIEEGRPDDVLRWHDRLAAARRFGPRNADGASLSVARAVSATHAERAIELYRAAAVGLIEQTKPDAYDEAGRHLVCVRDLLHAAGRASEWPAVIADLRASHGRKRRLMAVLDGLERRPLARRSRSGRAS